MTTTQTLEETTTTTATATVASDVREHIIERIRSTPVDLSPYPHLYTGEILPPDFYPRLMENLQHVSGYRKWTEIADISEEHYGFREQIYMRDSWLNGVPENTREIWNVLTGALMTESFMTAILRKFSPYLDRHFAETNSLWHEAILLRHKAKYYIGPHTDIPSKVITLLFYLAHDETTPHLGTSIYVPKESGFACNGNRHHKFDEFNRLATMPYAPNSMFAFVRTNNSFHAVDPIDDETSQRSPRNVIQYSIYDNPGCEPKNTTTRKKST